MNNEVLKKIIEALAPLGYDIVSVNPSGNYLNRIDISVRFSISAEEKEQRSS